MKLFIGKLTTLVALLLAVAWLTNEPDWEEPLVVAITLLSGLISMEVWPTIRSRKLSRHDERLIGEFTFLLPSSGTAIIFLKEHDMGYSFESSRLNDLDTFVRDWQNAEHEFDNPALEKKKMRFFNSVKLFLSDLSKNVNGLPGGYLSTGLDALEPGHATDRLKEIEAINALSSKAYEDHQSFVRLSRKLARIQTDS